MRPNEHASALGAPGLRSSSRNEEEHARGNGKWQASHTVRQPPIAKGRFASGTVRATAGAQAVSAIPHVDQA